MRRGLIALFLAAVFGLSAAASADQWSKSYSVSGAPDLWVSTGDGRVAIEAWDEPRIEARIDTVGYVINKDFQLIESQAGNQVRIETKFPKMSWNVGVHNRSLTLTVKVPRASNLDLHTGDGRITLAGVRGTMRLHTGDGTIDGRGLDGRLTASTGDGGVSVEGRFDALDLHTGDGAIEAAAAAGSSVAQPWRMETGDGSVTLRVPGDFKANVDARTGDGRITLDLPVVLSGEVKRDRVVGSINGGGGPLTVRTGDGAIHLGKL